MRRALYFCLFFTVACYGSQQSACDFGGGPTPIPPTPTPTATPSPSPTPTPTPTPVNCTPDWLRIEGSSVLAKNEARVYWLTPMQTIIKDGVPVQVPVLDSCNVPREREVEWSLEGDRSIAILSPNGFSVTVTRIAGAGNPSIPIFLRVEFGALYAVKVIS